MQYGHRQHQVNVVDDGEGEADRPFFLLVGITVLLYSPRVRVQEKNNCPLRFYLGLNLSTRLCKSNFDFDFATKSYRHTVDNCPYYVHFMDNC